MVTALVRELKMLRRKVETTDRTAEKISSKAKIRRKKRSSDDFRPLGEKRSHQDDEEKKLESLVLGGADDVIEVLENQTLNKDELEKRSAEKQKKPAWEDEDDVKGSIEITTDRRYEGLRQGEECRIRTDQYTTRLKNKFQNMSSTPNWAKLPSERKPESDEDSDVDDLMQKTGNYIATSSSLPKGILNFKQCKNANKESTAQGKLTSVEFHPSSQVILTAGFNQTLSLFQVDGKNNPKIQSVFIENFPIHTAHFSANGEEVVMGSKHKSFYYFDMMAGKMINVPWIKGIEETNMKRFKVSPDGRFLVFLGRYGAMHLISAQSKEWIDTLRMNGNVQAVAFSRDGSKMYSHGDDGEVFVWDMSTRQCIHHFYDEGCIQGTAIAASPNNQYLACGSNSGVVNIYDTDTCMKSRSPKALKAVMNLTTTCSDAIFNSKTEILAISSDYAERAVKLVHMPSMTVFSNFPDKVDENLRIPKCMDFSLNSGYFSIATHKGHALLYRLKHYSNY